jgi:hypothetical protein
LIALASATLLMDAQASYAGIHDPGANKHQHHQHNCIKQGIRSSKLTHWGAKGLAHEQKHIREQERARRADGKPTAAERRDLRQDEKQAGKHVYREKRDCNRC